MKDKKAFILYSDQREIFEKLPDEKAGELIKIIFAYVNDENPEIKDLLLDIAFSSIKNTLKRDLKKWEKQLEQRKEAGKKSAKVRWGKSNEKERKVTSVKSRERKVTDSVSVSVSVSETHRGEIFKKLKKYLEKFDNTNDPDKYARWFFGNYTEKNIEKSLNDKMVTSVDKLIKVLDFNKSKHV